ncbi:MAG: magnesium chelatase [Candidatus Tectomicrobia bacterium]|uniref:Magnesium chelatase n=1 Tax=Tectimicrobiota bacterium TaxID=2528274 RepID=A0A933GLC1_UNCTE|nr:magnesium chelatase [Candidatus Tectomicrobia bacterium]
MIKGTKATNLKELRESGYEVLTVKEELRKNLIRKIEQGEKLFPEIIGYENSVIPQLENAILSGQDIIILGERGQAKTKLIRSLTLLLDEYIPIIANCEINDHPYKPICKRCKELVAAKADATPIEWLSREERYGEKLATPDITTPDLIGEVDPIKVAEGRYLSDELTIHFGLIPRTNRGIFAINELPDLSEKIQVGLLNIMEERDVQIRGFRVRLPLDVYIVASANPEDYTNRGRIITPLKDRYGSQIRTHYPTSLDYEIEIMEQERTVFTYKDYKISIPKFMKEVIGEITRLARKSPFINQRSGVSARMSISNYENLVSNALRRAIRLQEKEVVPRVSDLPYLLASTIGKMELESIEEEKSLKLVEDLSKKAVKQVFDRYLKNDSFKKFLDQVGNTQKLEVGEDLPAIHYSQVLSRYNDLMDGVITLGSYDNAAMVASAVEFILEGLHLHEKLNKEEVAGRISYRG